ncbi:response regulator [Kovacikia minuta CCNUW1]|uniref:response regulator n=1 Tax=Kovacikia minuta TaxID=2931930 RepID=UPI001CCABBEF|nr:response regulator [Kovacikia minuta]UBF24704.1 response regulator [Kovacikia minuta CCNUW1]
MFTVLRHIESLKNLEQLQFSGQLLWTNPAGQHWSFYLSQGFIICATGGVHPVRRWRRNLATYCPRMPNHRIGWQFHLANCDPATLTFGWEYALLSLWVAQQDITSEQAAKMIRASIVEVLFDAAQAVDVTEQIRQDSSFSTQLSLIQIAAAIGEAQLLWQSWEMANLAAYSPNQAPMIKQPEQLRKHSSVESYQNLVELLNGQKTLRELAIKMQRNIVEVASSLLPFVQLGWVEFLSVADQPAPIYRGDSVKAPLPSTPSQEATTLQWVTTSPPASTPEVTTSQGALVACVDDSALVLKMMEQLLTSVGYQFLGVDDGLRAIGILLARKPDFIFLDLVMPNTNGYEICEQLRKLSCFRNTPIVILTGNDGYANRLRSSFVGASEFLSKPLDAGAVLSVIRKHLEQGVTRLSVTTDR